MLDLEKHFGIACLKVYLNYERSLNYEIESFVTQKYRGPFFLE